jgi:aspartate kinase
MGDPKICKVSSWASACAATWAWPAKMFRTLSEEGINIQMITTSEIKTSVVIDEKYMELAVRALHKAFELDGEPHRLRRPSERPAGVANLRLECASSPES